MTPEPARTLEVRRPAAALPGRWSRFEAWLVDKGLEIASLIPGFVAAVAAGGEADLVRFVAVAAPFYLGLWAYQAWLRATRGQTIGKRTRKLRIVSYEDGSNPGFWRAVFLRDLVPGFINFVVGMLFAPIDIGFILGRERRCVHDYMAETIVVHADAPDPWAAFD